MIATCPLCQNGFYISPDLAGNLVNCSKCKKQLRAPDRRARGLSSEPPPNDGIPIALIAETRAEVEERLKNETETRHELEDRLKKDAQTLAELRAQLSMETETRKKAQAEAQSFAAKLKDKGVEVSESEIASLKAVDSEAERKLKEAIDTKSKAEDALKAECHAKTEAQENLKHEVLARAELEARLSKETEARKKAEDASRIEKQNKAELEARLKAEMEARIRAETLKGAEDKGLAQLEAKLQEAEAARARAESNADSESQAKSQIEKLYEEEKEAKVKSESQWKIEVMAKRKAQTQLEAETKAREKAEAMAAEYKAKIQALEIKVFKRKSIDLSKGLMRLTFVLSFVLAAVAGYMAYINGYIINSHFDRPVRLPMFEQPVYLPIDLIAISVLGFMAAWLIYLIELFIIRGFRKSPPDRNMKNSPQPQVEEIVSFGEQKLWRST
jgi:hypothetical protein